MFLGKKVQIAQKKAMQKEKTQLLLFNKTNNKAQIKLIIQHI